MQALCMCGWMTDRTTINVDKENHQKANQVKEAHSESWPEVLEFYWKHRGNGYMYDKNPLDDLAEDVLKGGNVTFEEHADERTAIPEDIRDQLERIESAANTAEDRTGRIERTLEDLGGGR